MRRHGPRHGSTGRRLLPLVMAGAAALVVGGPSARGDDGCEFRSWWRDRSTSRCNTNDSSAGCVINPTNVPLLDKDFASLSMGTLAPPDTAAQIHAPEAHAVATGRGVTVAVLDSGFDTAHVRIAANVLPFGFDALDLDGDPNDAGNGIDDDGDGVADLGVGHGTFVADMVLLAAPDAMILPVRVADDEGRVNVDAVIRGIQYAASSGARVVNLSLGASVSDSRVMWAINRVSRSYGVTFVVSAGNDAAQDLGLIAQCRDTISVGAVDAFDQLAPFSNTAGSGEELSVLAPGVDLCGAGAPEHDSMVVWSGTSFAAGIVSGAAALVREAFPWYSAHDVEDRIEDSVDEAFDLMGEQVSGTGRINLAKAVGR